MLWKRGTTLLIGGIASISFGSTYTQKDLPGENCVGSRPSLCRMRRRVSDVCGSLLWRFRRDWSWRAEVSDWVARFVLDVPWIVHQRGWPYAESARASSWGTLGCCWGIAFFQGCARLSIGQNSHLFVNFFLRYIGEPFLGSSTS